MTHSDRIATEIVARADAATTGIKEAVDTFAAAMRVLREPEQDVEQALRSVANMYLAFEALAGVAKAGQDETKSALVYGFNESGCPGLFLAAHQVTPQAKPQSAEIFDPTVIPADCMTTPQPDRTEIRKRLYDGQDVPGARLSGNGEITVRFAPIKRGKK